MREYLFFLLNLLISRLVDRPIILYFHRIKTPDNNTLDRRVGVTEPHLFREVLKSVKKLGYQFVSLEELVIKVRESGLSRLAAITFDDGFIDLYQNAYPILQALGIPFTLFLTTSNVGAERLLWQHKLYFSIDRLSTLQRKSAFSSSDLHLDQITDFDPFVGKLFMTKNKREIEELVLRVAGEADLSREEERIIAKKLYLSVDHLREMKKHGLEIEVHGHEHWPLPNLDREETEEEVRESAQYLIQELNTSPRFFGLPFGVSNPYVRSIIDNLGFVGILTVRSRVISSFEDLHNLPRIGKFNDFPGFHMKLFRAYRRYLMAAFKTIIEKWLLFYAT